MDIRRRPHFSGSSGSEADAEGESDDRAVGAAGGGADRLRRRGESDAAGGAKHKKPRSV